MTSADDGRLALGRGSDNGPVILSELLERLMIRLRKPPIDVLSAVFKNWSATVGADVARHCRPVAVDANRLVVEADDHIWAGELKWHSETVLERIADVSGNRRIDQLVVSVGYHRPEVGGHPLRTAPFSVDTGVCPLDRSGPDEDGGQQRLVAWGRCP